METPQHNFALTLKLQAVCAAVSQRHQAVSVLQAWLPAASTGNGDWTLYASPLAFALNDPSLTQFRLKSCHYPVAFRNSMTGRVWRTGAVQVVQNLRLVPPTMHPRIYLSDTDLDRIGEALYIPVYDQQRPGLGPITVVEALLPRHTTLLPADLLSFLCDSLTALKLSVSNPLPQPIKRSALTGRRARAPADDSSPDLAHSGGGGAAPVTGCGATAAAVGSPQGRESTGGGTDAAAAAAASAHDGGRSQQQQQQPDSVAPGATAQHTAPHTSSSSAATGAQAAPQSSSCGSDATCHGAAALGMLQPASAPVSLAASGPSSSGATTSNCSSRLVASAPAPAPAGMGCAMAPLAWPVHLAAPSGSSIMSVNPQLLALPTPHSAWPGAPAWWSAAAAASSGSSGPARLTAAYSRVGAVPGMPAGDRPRDQGVNDDDEPYADHNPRKVRKLESRGMVRTQSMYRVDQALCGMQQPPALNTTSPAGGAEAGSIVTALPGLTPSSVATAAASDGLQGLARVQLPPLVAVGLPAAVPAAAPLSQAHSPV